MSDTNKAESIIQPINKVVAPNALKDLRIFSEEAYARWKELVTQEPKEALIQFTHGYYEIAFSFVNAQPEQEITNLRDRIFSLPTKPLPFIHEEATHLYNNYINAWRNKEKLDECYFWRISPEGFGYAIRGYTEDDPEVYRSQGSDPHTPGQVFDITLPIWRVSESILFANHLAKTFKNVESIAIWCNFTGLRGRRLTSEHHHIQPFSVPTDARSSTNEMELTAQATIQQIDDNLVEVLYPMLTRLYELFSFFKTPEGLIEKQIKDMQTQKS